MGKHREDIASVTNVHVSNQKFDNTKVPSLKSEKIFQRFFFGENRLFFFFFFKLFAS